MCIKEFSKSKRKTHRNQKVMSSSEGKENEESKIIEATVISIDLTSDVINTTNNNDDTLKYSNGYKKFQVGYFMDNFFNSWSNVKYFYDVKELIRYQSGFKYSMYSEISNGASVEDINNMIMKSKKDKIDKSPVLFAMNDDEVYPALKSSFKWELEAEYNKNNHFCDSIIKKGYFDLFDLCRHDDDETKNMKLIRVHCGLIVTEGEDNIKKLDFNIKEGIESSDYNKDFEIYKDIQEKKRKWSGPDNVDNKKKSKKNEDDTEDDNYEGEDIPTFMSCDCAPVLVKLNIYSEIIDSK
jgi:hypothetical protein